MGTFNVVHIQPLNVMTTQGHWDVARLVYHSLQSLGHRAGLQVNVFDPQAMNIVVGYERLVPEAIPKDAPYIPYQLEQLATGGTTVTPAMLHVLRGAREIWEYSPQNIPLLQNAGLPPVKFLPLGYHQALAAIVPQAREDIDVLFYGLLRDRRKSILDKLSAHCIARGLQCCVTVLYEGLVDSCLSLLRDPVERERITAAGCPRFQRLPMTDFLQKVLP